MLPVRRKRPHFDEPQNDHTAAVVKFLSGELFLLKTAMEIMTTTMFGRAAMALAMVCSVTLAFAAQAQGQALAQEGPWLDRVRAAYLDSGNTDNTDLAATLTINDNWIPELDVSYFCTPNFAAELMLTSPQKQTIYADCTEIGSFKYPPPTLTAQHHFTGRQGFRPYVGVGLNRTHISSVNLLGGAAALQSTGYGLAAQVGVDVPLGNGWLLNADLKKVQIKTDVLVGASEVNHGSFKIDPWPIGVGAGKRF
jgi:outer membrane protein